MEGAVVAHAVPGLMMSTSFYDSTVSDGNNAG